MIHTHKPSTRRISTMFSFPSNIEVPSWLAALVITAIVGYYALGQWIRRPKNTSEAAESRRPEKTAEEHQAIPTPSSETRNLSVLTQQPANAGEGKIRKNDSDAVVKQKAVDTVNMIVDRLQAPAKVPTQSISEPSVLEGASGVRFIGARVGQGAFTAVAGDMVIGYDGDTSLEPSDTSEIADYTVAAPRALRGVRDMVVANSEVQGGAFTAVAGDARISLREQRREAPPLYSEVSQGQKLVA
ncbi:hypothetical protein GYMLUDRAFT_85275, partial [Collybiopsis luxurians FD-317 M1]